MQSEKESLRSNPNASSDSTCANNISIWKYQNKKNTAVRCNSNQENDTWFERILDQSDAYNPTKNENQRHSSEESRLSVTVARNRCSECGTTTLQQIHLECTSPIIRIDEEWRCASCGVKVHLEESCHNCGSQVDIEPVDIPLDFTLLERPTDIERLVHDETNRQRSNHGISTLNYSNHLSAIALQHSRDMAQRDFFDHTDPDGSDTVDRYQKFDHDARSAGENIALEYPGLSTSPMEAAQSVVDSWMNSKGHRKNILREQFEKEGIGVYLDSDGGMYVTQNFY